MNWRQAHDLAQCRHGLRDPPETEQHMGVESLTAEEVRAEAGCQCLGHQAECLRAASVVEERSGSDELADAVGALGMADLIGQVL